jgi:glutathione reductase (NADPH)
VPKKIMWHAADLRCLSIRGRRWAREADFGFAWCREKLHQANAYGYKIPEEQTKIDWPTLKEKRDKYIERLNGIYERSGLPSR